MLIGRTRLRLSLRGSVRLRLILIFLPLLHSRALRTLFNWLALRAMPCISVRFACFVPLLRLLSLVMLPRSFSASGLKTLDRSSALRHSSFNRLFYRC